MSIFFTSDMFRRFSRGAAAYAETPAGFTFQRFTEEQRKVYPENGDFWQKSFACSGIELVFATDAEKLAMHWCAGRGSSRKFVWFDCFVNGKLLKHDGVEDYENTPEGILEAVLPGRRCEVRIVFPNLAKIAVKSLELSENCSVEALPVRRKMLAFGDSITQGYDTVFPSQCYITLLAEKLNLELVNKGIGGERFNPALLDSADPFTPALITVAYGTNDWKCLDEKSLKANAEKFLEKLAGLYPGIPVVMLLPIWRGDCGEITAAGSFDAVRDFLRRCGGNYPQIRVIQPELPHDLRFFSPDGVHPNDEGAIRMFRSIAEQLKSY